MEVPIFDIVDIDLYPLDRMSSSAYVALRDRCRRDLQSDGCAVLKGFLRPQSTPMLAGEADRVAPKAHRSYNQTNAYFTVDDPGLPSCHPRRRFYPRSNAFVPADNFGADSLLRAIYEWPAFSAFVQDALEEPVFYRYADPLADVIVNVVEPGGGFPWHFDTNNFTVTLAIQNGEGGGLFEYCPNLRGPEDENYGGVAAVLDGHRDPVQTLHLEPGDLQIFRGRYSLHRVSAVAGSRSRYVGIFSYAEEPGMVGRLERTHQLYGRVLPIHLEREAALREDKLDD